MNVRPTASNAKPPSGTGPNERNVFAEKWISFLRLPVSTFAAVGTRQARLGGRQINGRIAARS
ncbi:hypothetical protein ZHAS_00010868 [Anopheles sinensis]|uniref:Uncharacterized protein n=1 Tax=Anopheles sinensis TaxID=74873 RepID=A0A084VYE7_ANOSI|nr:hypothetical protein ZHAS_00010868 [Anopheles sinensis]